MAKKGYLLIIDDAEEIQIILECLFKAEGYSVVSVQTASDALKALEQKNAFSLILLDLNLPDMSGDELISKITQATLGNSPIILFSAGEKRERDFLPKGIIDFIRKPFDIADLIARVARHIKSPVLNP